MGQSNEEIYTVLGQNLYQFFSKFFLGNSSKPFFTKIDYCLKRGGRYRLVSIKVDAGVAQW